MTDNNLSDNVAALANAELTAADLRFLKRLIADWDARTPPDMFASDDARMLHEVVEHYLTQEYETPFPRAQDAMFGPRAIELYLNKVEEVAARAMKPLGKFSEDKKRETLHLWVRCAALYLLEHGNEKWALDYFTTVATIGNSGRFQMILRRYREEVEK